MVAAAGGRPGIEKIIDLKYYLFSDFKGEFPSIFQGRGRPLKFTKGGHALTFPGGTSPPPLDATDFHAFLCKRFE